MKKFISSLIANTQDRRKRGFTLIELLIVIGILGILVVAVLLTLNPAEAQKKTRDTKRMKDLGTIESILSQYSNNGGNFASCGAPGSETIGDSTGNSGSTNAVTGWLSGILGSNAGDFSAYTTSVPVDPLQSGATAVTRKCAGVAGGVCVTGQGANMKYFVACSNDGSYEVGVRQEATSNLKNVGNPPGSGAPSLAVTGTKLTILTDVLAP